MLFSGGAAGRKKSERLRVLRKTPDMLAGVRCQVPAGLQALGKPISFEAGGDKAGNEAVAGAGRVHDFDRADAGGCDLGSVAGSRPECAARNDCELRAAREEIADQSFRSGLVFTSGAEGDRKTVNPRSAADAFTETS